MEKNPNPQLPKFMSGATLWNYLVKGTMASVLSQEEPELWRRVKNVSPPTLEKDNPLLVDIFRPAVCAIRIVQNDGDAMEEMAQEFRLKLIQKELQSPFFGVGITWMAALEEEKKKLLICFRGSETVKDWAVNVDFERTNLKESPFNFHRGMFQSIYPHYISQIRPFVFSFIAENDGFEIVFCGHSLGGAYATICSILFNSDLFYDRMYYSRPSSPSSSPPLSPLSSPPSSSSSPPPSPSSSSSSSSTPTSPPPTLPSTSPPLSSLFSTPSLSSLQTSLKSEKTHFFSEEAQKSIQMARGRNYTTKCVTFGSPQVTFSKLSLPELFDLKGKPHPMLYFTDFTQFYHIINDHDIVPRLLGQNPQMPEKEEIEFPGKYKTIGNVYLLSPEGEIYDCTDFSECVLETEFALQRGFQKSFEDHKTKMYHYFLG